MVVTQEDSQFGHRSNPPWSSRSTPGCRSPGSVRRVARQCPNVDRCDAGSLGGGVRRSGHLDREPRALTGRRFKLKRAAQLRDSLADTDQPQSSRWASALQVARVESGPIVFDRDQHRRTQSLQVHAAHPGVCVLGDVGEPLLHHTIQRGFELGGEALIHPGMEQLRLNAVTLFEAAKVGLQCRRQSEVVEQGRPQQMGQISNRLQGVFRHLTGVLEARGGRGRRLGRALRQHRSRL